MNLLRKTFGGAKPEKAPEEEKPQGELQPEAGSVGATLWSLLSSKLGGDVLTAGISLPSWIYEPLSILQRQAEMIEYGQVLTAASKTNDPVERLAHLAGFAVSGYSATQRYKPNFNPMLGETFEFVDPRNNTKFFAEQVSHHPPISAIHAMSDDWVFWQNSSPTTKFLGNNLDLDTRGKTHVQFPKTGEHYFYTNPQCTRIHNIIIGSMWIEHFGVLDIKSLDGSLSCTVNFKKSGLFQGVQYKVEGFIEDKNGKKLVKIEGRWDESIEAKWLVDTVSNKKGTVKKLWEIEKHDSKDQMSPYSRSLNDFDRSMEEVLLLSDSRRRLDRRFLEFGDTDTATAWKKIMEERQRTDRKGRKDYWQPVWFKRDETFEGPDGKGFWVYCSNFWEQREEKLDALRQGQDVQSQPSILAGLACDFTSYHSVSGLPDKVPESDDATQATDTNNKDGTDSDQDNNSLSEDFENGDCTPTEDPQIQIVNFKELV